MEYELVRLAHSGVKGMKWGIRRYQNPDGTLTAAGKRRYAKTLAKVREQEKILKNQEATKAKIDRLNARVDALNQKTGASSKKTVSEPSIKTEKKLKKKSIKDMTDEELQARIARLGMEDNVKKLEKNTKSRGRAFIEDVLETSGKNIATQLTTYVMGTAVNKIAEKAGVKNASKTIKGEDGVERIVKVFEDLVNPKKGQKDK